MPLCTSQEQMDETLDGASQSPVDVKIDRYCHSFYCGALVSTTIIGCPGVTTHLSLYFARVVSRGGIRRGGKSSNMLTPQVSISHEVTPRTPSKKKLGFAPLWDYD